LLRPDVERHHLQDRACAKAAIVIKGAAIVDFAYFAHVVTRAHVSGWWSDAIRAYVDYGRGNIPALIRWRGEIGRRTGIKKDLSRIGEWQIGKKLQVLWVLQVDVW
jgi:hypothetical protein